MKLQEIYDRLDVIFSEIQVTRCVTTQSDIENATNQYQLKGLKIIPKIDYDDITFNLQIKFTDESEMLKLYDSAFQLLIRLCFEILEVDVNLVDSILLMRLHIVW